jgi:D-alanyl-D-alanine carboxypeptidase
MEELGATRKFLVERGAYMGCSHPHRSPWHPRCLRLHIYGFLVVAFGLVAAATAAASPAIVMDVATGNVLYEQQADEPWYPASLTKLMTIYVALSAVRDHQITLDTPLVVSARAASMAPSKMGFAPGTEVTLDNALKMLIVKSANDIAVTVAEGIAGSVEAFAEDMNRSAAQLGMTQSHFVNPNGLHDPGHVSSAHDLAIVARALYVQFPDYAGLFGIGALRLGDEIISTHNDLLGRYPGADGMKTGFTCSAGFNLVASADRGGHRYIAVVLGAPSIRSRLVRTAVLLDRAFAGIDHPHPMSAEDSVDATPPDMHDAVCRRRAETEIEWEAETEHLEEPLSLPTTPIFPANGFLFNAAPAADRAPMASRIALMPAPVFDPVAVYIGAAPGYLGPVAEARPPHSPIGTPSPPAAATAYTEDKPQGLETSATPIKPDAAALPMKGRLAKKADKKSASQKSEKGSKLAQHEPNEDEADTELDTKAVAKKHSTKAVTVEKHKAKTIATATHKAKVIGKVEKVHKIAKAKSSRTASKMKKLAAKPAKLAAKPKLKPASAPD